MTFAPPPTQAFNEKRMSKENGAKNRQKTESRSWRLKDLYRFLTCYKI